MSNNNQIQLVECARYHMATRYSTESKRPATISLGGLYWKSHTPASTEDAEFINRAVAAANSCVTPLAAPPVNGDAAGTGAPAPVVSQPATITDIESLPLLLTQKAFAKAAGVCCRTVWRMIRDGKLRVVPTYRSGKRIPRAELLRLPTLLKSRGAKRDRLLSQTAFAQAIGTSSAEVRRMLKEGTVASVRTASSGRRIPVSEVSRVLQGGRNGTNERD